MARMRIETAPGAAWIGDYMAGLHDGFDQYGSILFDGRNTIREDVVAGRRITVKRFRKDKGLKKLINRFRKGKAVKSFRNALRLASLGVDTPEPLAYMEVRDAMGFRKAQYYVCAYTDEEAIEDWVTDPERFDALFMTSLAKFVADLHGKGVIHKDLNNTNIRWRREGHACRFSLIDINRMRFYDGGKLPTDVRLRNLTHFSGLTEGFRYFVRAYLRTAMLPEGLYGESIRIKRHVDAAYGRKKRFTNAVKQLFS